MKAEGAVADQPDLRVEPLEAAVGEAEADGGENAGAVAADGAREPEKGTRRDRVAQASQASRCAGASLG